MLKRSNTIDAWIEEEIVKLHQLQKEQPENDCIPAMRHALLWVKTMARNQYAPPSRSIFAHPN